MFVKLKNFFKNASVNGLYLPFVHDPVTKKPSITLLFSYVTFLMSVLSVILLHFKQTLIIPTFMTIMFWVLAVIFYMIRTIQKAKIDLDEKSIELEGEEEDNN